MCVDRGTSGTPNFSIDIFLAVDLWEIIWVVCQINVWRLLWLVSEPFILKSQTGCVNDLVAHAQMFLQTQHHVQCQVEFKRRWCLQMIFAELGNRRQNNAYGLKHAFLHVSKSCVSIVRPLSSTSVPLQQQQLSRPCLPRFRSFPLAPRRSPPFVIPCCVITTADDT